ncbi:MAG: hypothetical protein U0736_13620 [Gemmataceae bacterium]
MLDIDLIRKDRSRQANCVNHNVSADVDRVLALDDDRKRLVTEAQVSQQRANEVAKKTGGEDPARSRLIAESKAAPASRWRRWTWRNRSRRRSAAATTLPELSTPTPRSAPPTTPTR